jgi:pyruvate formate lyase activating enzyme
VETLARARDIGIDAGLHHVYTGNVPGHEGESTFCPDCGVLLIARWGYRIEENHLKSGRCHRCEAIVAGLRM